MIQKPRGTQDYFGKEFATKWELENKFVNFYLMRNYQGIETPIFEQRSLFVRSAGEETEVVQKQLFDLDKKSEEIYSLRPEFTAGIVRALIDLGIKAMPLPVKTFSIGPCFRYERPQKGRRRQFDQLNIEVMGKKSPELDARVICDAIEFMKEAGVDAEVAINTLGSKETREKYSLNIQKFMKEQAGDLCDLCNIRTVKNPLRVLDCKGEKCKEIAKDIPSIVDALTEEENDYFKTIQKILDSKKIKYNLDKTLIRGLDYYTGVIFEFNLISDELRASSIGGGGRYDELVEELGGPNMPAIGMALGYERLIDLSKED